MYSEANDAINLNVSDQVGKKSTLLHELQHAVQQREGFARGGSVEGMRGDYERDAYRLQEVERTLTKYQNAASDEARYAKPEVKAAAEAWAKQNGEMFDNAPIEEKVKDYLLNEDRVYASLYKEHAGLKYGAGKKTPEQRYKSLAGEAEARAVQSRMGLNPQQRRDLFPLDSYDVPINGLIYR